jgi:hypothetical protein
MSYEAVLIITVFIVFLITAVTFINIGIKLSVKDPKPIKILPKFYKKVEETPEAKAERERIDMINNFTGYKEQ